MTDHNRKNIFVNSAIASSLISKSIEKHSNKTAIGGHSIFLGQVRADQVGDKHVREIEYSAYEPLALETMHTIREEIFQKYPLICMHVYHGLGKIAVGEICLFVFTSSAHRKAAIDGCEEIVERIKIELSIWRKEIFEDETHQ